MAKPTKIPVNDAFKSTTMFLICDAIENETEAIVDKTVSAMKKQLIGIGSKDGLKKFIIENKDAISLIITLLKITEEKFKRVISWIRLSMGYTFDSEWTPQATRKHLIDNAELLNDFCDLFTEGYKMDKFKSIIPKFILQDFKIDSATMGRLGNDDFIRSLVKAKVQTSYNGQCANFYNSLLRDKIRELADTYGLTYNTDMNLSYFPNYPIEGIEFNGRRIIFVSSYLLTTSSSQTSYAENQISPLYQSLMGHPDTILVNILDGAGWVGRSADFKKIYADCHYFLNLKNIDKLKEIIEYHFNITAQ